MFGGKVKIWGELSRKKKSMQGQIEKYWVCEGQLLHKGLEAQNISHYEASGVNLLVVVYPSTVVFMVILR